MRNRSSTLGQGQVLNQNECLISTNKMFYTVLQNDNNLVIYEVPAGNF